MFYQFFKKNRQNGNRQLGIRQNGLGKLGNVKMRFGNLGRYMRDLGFSTSLPTPNLPSPFCRIPLCRIWPNREKVLQPSSHANDPFNTTDPNLAENTMQQSPWPISTIKLGHINVCSWTLENGEHRKQIINAMYCDMICISEIHLHVDSVIHISGYRWFGFNRSDIHVTAPIPSRLNSQSQGFG